MTMEHATTFNCFSYQSVGHSGLHFGAGVEDSHGVDGGGDPGLMGQPIWERSNKGSDEASEVRFGHGA